MLTDFEKLGAFYLGRALDPNTRKPIDAPLLYDSKDLVTHAVCVGMTGSGKTGLCLGLLEEAAIDGVPAILIDPKGDLSNLLLTFPDLKAADFEPWVNADDAARKGIDVPAFAQQQADLWEKGLATWGQSGDRIRKLRESADFAVYTPGSTAGIPVSILRSFARPGDAVMEDAELLREQVATGVTGLLGLAGIDAEPLQSREHILLSTIIAAAWNAGRDVDLAGLIQQVQDPPVQRVGVLDLEAFYPRKERFELAMRLNNVIAAPGFESWTSGEPLDVAAFLHTPAGKPRVSIFSIAHLSDAERMFFVSLLLNHVLAWTRSQPGTTSLRAILYMDEIFGYLPPTANPPSKRPMLTLLKQARAFGVGVVLATQNPVDLDYKALSNCGTWFIGRLQTERDKLRVLDGLEGAAASASSPFERREMETLLSSLGNRVFLMNNVHEDEPVLFETRWVMSYLRGPLTRSQIKQLMAPRKAAGAAAAPAGGERSALRAAASPAASAAAARPVLPPGVPQVFLPVRSPRPGGATLVYRPAVLGAAQVYFSDAKSGASHEHRARGWRRWTTARRGSTGRRPPRSTCRRRISTRSRPTAPRSRRSRRRRRRRRATPLGSRRWSTRAVPHVARRLAPQRRARPGEPPRRERTRLSRPPRAGVARARDEAVEKLRQKYGPKLAAIGERIRKAELARQAQEQQAASAKWSTAMSVGATVLGALFGRKAMSRGTIGKATTAARGANRSYQESQDVARAEQNVQALRQQAVDLDARSAADIEVAADRYDAATETLERVPLRPKKTDIKVRLVALAWAPYWQGGGDVGADRPAWE